MIIVEGPDGGGKSTLVKNLVKTFGLALSEHSQLSDVERNDESYRAPENVRKRLYTALLREVTGRNHPEIHDRLFFSSMVYDHVFGRPQVFNFHEEVHIGRLLNALKVPTIFCLPPLEEINKQYLSHNQMEGVPEHIHKIYHQYVAMSKMMSRQRVADGVPRRLNKDYNLPKVTMYDFTDPKSLEEVHEVVSKYLVYRTRRTERWVR